LGHISYLTRRGAVYYARMDVPEDLVPFLKTQTRKQSLKTTDAAVAKRRLMMVITGWQREFDDLRTRRTLVAADHEHAIWDHYTNALARDDNERSNLPGEAEIDAERSRLFAARSSPRMRLPC
jgi:hypothetical protein